MGSFENFENFTNCQSSNGWKLLISLDIFYQLSHLFYSFDNSTAQYFILCYLLLETSSLPIFLVWVSCPLFFCSHITVNRFLIL
ncbi:hypothetical protein ES288_A11G112500v1 [Gossypium darwinii]|uniref:Uncharacterized protein n=1 Tax=Gossypium darwinii TaxID=34276 RepID=A0A5D2EIM2_GOSDA|nr:hypothetical protein ES288_A11G112500v1 [Gossypium darwinii]TYG93462.1 hypothetical protein ES288_A11G112500v1 [Gossypium darwinii]TYG93463.1 hypothetical protein ES288_A11G112500v1 [Gossypium darwinii]TYG93464.1 hypothetical protein ES288_A11G112500v1 [Gossypium darwinii]